MTHTRPQLEHSAQGLRVGLVVSRYHETITSRLADGATQAFLAADGSIDDITRLDAPGAFELPVMADAMAYTGEFDGIVALGCVITGETTHDQYISQAVASALMQLSVEASLPIGFGVLTCQTLEQAQARAGGDRGNKGAEAMKSVIQTAGELKMFHLSGHSEMPDP